MPYIGSRAVSPQTQKVLAALAHHPTAWRYGYELCEELGLKPGTLYPILVRLEKRGVVESKWSPYTPPGRPARHLYRLRPEGADSRLETLSAIMYGTRDGPL